MYLLTQQNGPVRHVVSLYSERGSGIYTLHPYLKNDSYFIVLKKSRNISLCIPQNFSSLGFAVSEELGNKQTDRLTDRLALL